MIQMRAYDRPVRVLGKRDAGRGRAALQPPSIIHRAPMTTASAEAVSEGCALC